jgi:hypothetical protein
MADARHVYLIGGTDLVAVPKECVVDPCIPEWRAPLGLGSGPTDVLRVQLAVGDGVVYVTTDESLLAFDVNCGTDGATCAPVWTAQPPQGGSHLTSPVAFGRSVRVIYTLGGEGNIEGVRAAVYSEDSCRGGESSCEPIWDVGLGPGTIYSPGRVVDGVFYQQVGDRMSGIGPDCSSPSGACDVVFSVRALGDPHSQASSLYGPVSTNGELVVASGDGNLYGYAPGCGSDCEPLWFGRAAEYLEGDPVVAGGVVVVTVSHEIVAFQPGCRSDGGTCEPAWRGELRGYGTIVHADERFTVVRDHLTTPGRITVFDSSCNGPCPPLWTAETPGRAQEVVSDGQHVFVGIEGGKIVAYPLECSDGCLPVWRADVDGVNVWSLFLDRAGLYAVATGEGPVTPEQNEVEISGFRVTG